MRILTALGLMSGTSMDGIDIALIRSDGKNIVERGPFLFVPYHKEFRTQITNGLVDALAIKTRAQRPGNLKGLEKDITRFHERAVRQFLETYKINASEIDLIGFHGHTILHRPDDGLTVQLGDGQMLCNNTGVETIYDMRANDINNGGQGAPLVPVYHRALAHKIRQETGNNSPIAFVNIGGISNVTYVGEDNHLIAFDCGPGNALIDQWVSQIDGIEFDEDGLFGKRGKILKSVCDQYMDHPYFDLPIPKSLDRNDFKPLVDNKISLNDGARSLAHVTALAILQAANKLPKIPSIWVICGGGAQNPVIMDDLRAMIENKTPENSRSNPRVVSADQIDLSSMAMEAEAFAYLAIRSKHGAYLTYPQTTGCGSAQSGGICALSSPASARPCQSRINTKRAL